MPHMRLLSPLLALAVAAAATPAAAAPPAGLCGMVNSDGSMWDFAALALNATQPPYLLTPADEPNRLFALNLCAPLAQTQSGYPANCYGGSPNLMVCDSSLSPDQQNKAFWLDGSPAPTWSLSSSGEPTMTTFTRATTCKANGDGQTVKFVFKCAQNQAAPSFVVKPNDDQCLATVEVYTQLACQPVPAPGCVLQRPDGAYFDLSPLRGRLFYTSGRETGVYMGLCGTYVPCWPDGDHQGAPFPNAWSCYQMDGGGCAGGTWDKTAQWTFEDGEPLLVTKTSPCNGQPAYVRLTCARETGELEYRFPGHLEFPPSNFTMRLATPHACPKYDRL